MGVINRYIEVDNEFAVDLFPYKVKDVNSFYFRDHPENLNPRTFRYRTYWNSFLKCCLEGKWINDNGTWVFMMPKLFFYINYIIISDEDREKINPRLRDNEWITFTYLLCSEGFSGFEGDTKYTCNKYVKKINDGLKLQKYEQKALDADPFVKNEAGEYKEYVDPWIYLTETYLITDNQGKPLGRPVYANGYYHVIIMAARGLGKALALDTPVLSDSGWKPIQDVLIGDKVYGSDGKLCNVIDISGKQEDLVMYKITLSDGRTIDACENHLWKVWKRTKNKSLPPYTTKSTKEILEKYYSVRVDSKHRQSHGVIRYVNENLYALPLPKPIEYNEANLPINPYFLGLWLGDGASHRVAITTADSEIKNYCYKVAEEWGLSVTINQNTRKTCPTYHLSSGNMSAGQVRNKKLINEFKTLNLFNNKHIPEIYKTASVEQRLELLRGLMDSDGTASGGDISFNNSNKTLAYDVLDLVRSLGMYVSMSSDISTLYGVKHKEAFNVKIKTNKRIFSLPRKIKIHNESQPKGVYGTGRLERVYIKDITRIDNANGYCISVDNEDKTYITKDYIVTHNSYSAFPGDFIHEWIFGNIRKWEDRKKVNNDALFGITSSVTKSLSRSVANLSRSYTQMPGQFNFPSSKKDQTVKYWGPFYKNIRGTWSVSQSGSNIQHILKSKRGGKELINGSQVNISLLGTNDFKPFTGDRFRRGYIEEVGFCGQIKKLFAASKDAFEVGKNQVGQMYMLGTSGDSNTIGDVKDMFENPEAYNIFPIPNYWSKIESKKCGLFLAAYYKAEEFKDNGNTNLAEALFDVIKNRELKKSQLDSVAFGMDIMWNPIYPKELLRPTHKSVIPVQELSEHREYLVINDINKKLSAVGALKYANDGSVKFVPDLGNTLAPILEWGRDKELEDTTGAWIIHEDRPSFIPDGLYYILYDPYTQSGEGTSLQSILVYKHKFKTTGNDESLQNTIVASYIGRYPDLDKSYEEAIKAAIYFNAKVFPELNSIGFAEYVLRKNYQYLMQRTPLNVLKSIKGSTYSSHSRSAYTFGLKVNEAMNIWSINKLANWFVDPVSVDPVTEIPTWRTYQNIRDLRLLSEAISFDFNNKPDFDSMSALMLLPYLLSDLDDTTVEIPLEDDDDPYARYKEPEYIPKKVSKLSQTI